MSLFCLVFIFSKLRVTNKRTTNKTNTLGGGGAGTNKIN